MVSDVQRYAAALIRRLEKERDEARNKALDDANAIVQKARFGEIDQDLRSISHAILALKSKEPT